MRRFRFIFIFMGTCIACSQGDNDHRGSTTKTPPISNDIESDTGDITADDTLTDSQNVAINPEDSGKAGAKKNGRVPGKTAPPAVVACGDGPTPEYPLALADATFSVKNAYWLMWASYLAYQDLDTVPETSLKGFGYKDLTAVTTAEGLDAFVGNHDTHILLAFRGSKENKDFLDDLKFRTVPALSYGGIGFVHSGFDQQFESAKVEILDLVQNWTKGASKPVVITGHSLGGSLALLAAMALEDAGYKVGAVYTFGQGRTGDAIFSGRVAATLKGRYFRVVNESDVVAHLPPAASAATEFGEMIAKADSDKGVLGSVSRFGTAALVTAMNYSHAPELYQIESGIVSLDATYNDSYDKKYWVQGRDELSPKDFLGSSNTDSGKKKIDDHRSSAYLCALKTAKAR